MDFMNVHELVGKMKTGWNLGNALDAIGGETAWSNPVTTREMIDKVAEAGFDIIRIPVTWGEKMDDGSFAVAPEWMERVNEVVDYAVDNDMFVILNCHHETSWIRPATDELDGFLPKYKALWQQIAARFERYGEKLLFEGLNEPRIVGGENEWNGGTADGRKALNILNKTFVDTVRASGGNNRERALLITTFAAAVTEDTLNDLVIPDDGRIIVSLHAYTPYSFTYHSKESWEQYIFTESAGKEIDGVFGLIDRYLTDKNIPVIITEYGSVSKSQNDGDERNNAENEKWARYYLERAKKSGIPCVWWDNGYYTHDKEQYGIFDRRDLTWFVPGLVDTIMSVYSSDRG